MFKIEILRNQAVNRRWYNFTVLPVTVAIVLNYFEIYYHYWFISLCKGYVIKIWLLPFLLLMFFLTRESINGKIRFPSRNIEGLNKILFCYVLIGFAALFIHEELWNLVKFSLLMFGPVMLYLAIIYGLRSNSDIEKILHLLFILGFIFAIYVTYLFSFVGPDAWKSESIERNFMFSDVSATLDPQNYNTFYIGEEKGRVTRSSIPGMDEPKFGGILAPLVIVGFYFTMNSKRFAKIFYGVSSVFLFYSVMATISRSAIIALIIGTIIFFSQRVKKISELFTVFIIFGLSIGILLFTEGAIDRIIQLISSVDFFRESEFVRNLVLERGIYVREEGHVASYSEGIKTLTDGPLFGILGVGMQNFLDMFADNRWGSPHNRYMIILDTVGFLTLAPYVWFIILLIIKVRNAFYYKIKNHIAINNIGHIFYPVSVLIALKLTNEGFETYYYWTFFGLTAAWIRNSAYGEKSENPAN